MGKEFTLGGGGGIKVQCNGSGAMVILHVNRRSPTEGLLLITLYQRGEGEYRGERVSA